MATEQSLIQIRVDTQLKEQTSEVFEKIGIDILTAVRMFFKATVHDQRLPLSTNVAGDEAQVKQQIEEEKLMRAILDILMYEQPKYLKPNNKKGSESGEKRPIGLK